MVFLGDEGKKREAGSSSSTDAPMFFIPNDGANQKSDDRNHHRPPVDHDRLLTPLFQPGAAARGVPHFSQLSGDDWDTDFNPVTGRSVNFGHMPWRCSDRASDWIQSISALDWPSVHLHHVRTIWRCATSDLGDEPVIPYERLPLVSAHYYRERASSGMMRRSFWERSPYNYLDVRQLCESDALKMRLWRQQRQLEEQAKRGIVEDLIMNNISKKEK